MQPQLVSFEQVLLLLWILIEIILFLDCFKDEDIKEKFLLDHQRFQRNRKDVLESEAFALSNKFF